MEKLQDRLSSYWWGRGLRPFPQTVILLPLACLLICQVAKKEKALTGHSLESSAQIGRAHNLGARRGMRLTDL